MNNRTGKHIDPQKVEHPSWYNSHPSGIEAIEIVEHMSFNLGNAFKYVYRAGAKGDLAVDLQKAAWYLRRELRLTRSQEFLPDLISAECFDRMHRVIQADPNPSRAAALDSIYKGDYLFSGTINKTRIRDAMKALENWNELKYGEDATL